MLADKGYDGRAADIWSMGVILFVMHAGFLPFDEPHMSALFRKIQKAQYTVPVWFSPEIAAFIAKILVPTPATRMTLDDILADPWFVGPDNFSIAAAGDAAAAEAAAGDAAAGAAAAAIERASSPKEIERAVGTIADAIDVAVSSPASPAVLAPPATSTAVAKPPPAGAAEPTPSPRVTGCRSTAGGAGEPRRITAADAAALLGGIDLSKLAPAPLPPACAAGDEAPAPAAPSLAQFLSALPPAELLERVGAAMAGVGLSTHVNAADFKVKGDIKTSHGEIRIAATVYTVAPGVCLVDIQRMGGEVRQHARRARPLCPRQRP